MQKIVFIFILLSLYYAPIWAQDSLQHLKYDGIILGNILEDESGKGIPSSLILLQDKDSLGSKHKVLSDKNGAFLFEHLPYGLYKIEIGYIGFATLTIDSIKIRSDKTDFNLGDLRLHKNTNQLNEVVVYSERPLIENKDGKIVYNVAESPLSNGSNAADMLKTMPLINTNPDGTCLLYTSPSPRD